MLRLVAAALVAGSVSAGGAVAGAQPGAVDRPPPAPVAGRGAADRADEALADDARAAARLTGAALGAADGPGDPSRADARRGEALTVYLMTIGQGSAVWERFGHNALWIHDAATGTDVAYNWGMFDFEQPNFVGRFLTGDTKYWMEGFDANALAAHYAQRENRSVYVQELALSAAQRAALLEFVEWNAREEHRYYRYDYYRDNCSTRVRDAIDRVTGGALRRALAGRPTPTSWRWHTRRLVAGDAATYTGIQLALGRPADRPIDAWELGFLPVQLMQELRDVRLPGPDGRAVPLVRGERTLFSAPREAEAAAPPTYAPWLFGAGVALGGLLLLLGRAARAGGGAARLGLGVLGGGWGLVTGLAGTALLLAGTVTRHEAYMGRNLNLLLVSPLGLLLVGVVAAAVLVRTPAARARWRGRAARLTGFVAAISVVGAAAIALPRLGQGSDDLVLLVLPVHLALFAAMSQLARGAARVGATEHD